VSGEPGVPRSWGSTHGTVQRNGINFQHSGGGLSRLPLTLLLFPVAVLKKSAG
jgi:hypothetical protein